MPEYQTHSGRPHATEEAARTYGDELKEGAARVGEKVAEQAQVAADETGRLAGEIAAAARERPYATIAIAAGLAFALGALWRMRTARQHSNLDGLLARLPDLPSPNSILPRSWR